MFETIAFRQFVSGLKNISVVTARSTRLLIHLSEEFEWEWDQFFRALALFLSGTVFFGYKKSNDEVVFYEKFTSGHHPHGRAIMVNFETNQVKERAALEPWEVKNGKVVREGTDQPIKWGLEVLNPASQNMIDTYGKPYMTQFHYLALLLMGLKFAINESEATYALWYNAERSFKAVELRRQGLSPVQVRAYFEAEDQAVMDEAYAELRLEKQNEIGKGRVALSRSTEMQWAMALKDAQEKASWAAYEEEVARFFAERDAHGGSLAWTEKDDPFDDDDQCDSFCNCPACTEKALARLVD